MNIKIPKNSKAPIPTGEIVNPQNLKPIHLRKILLPPLSPRTRIFGIKNGAGNIVKRRETGIKNYLKKCDQEHRLPRKKSIFFEDSAVEDDGFGMDTKSTATTTPPEVILIQNSSVKPLPPLVLPFAQARTLART